MKNEDSAAAQYSIRNRASAHCDRRTCRKTYDNRLLRALPATSPHALSSFGKATAYRLREKRTPIERANYRLRRQAWVFNKTEMRNDPDKVVTEVRGSWEGERSLFFRLPSASGSIVDSKNGVEYAVWQKRYIATIDKTHILGKTSDSVDLYRVPPFLHRNGRRTSHNQRRSIRWKECD